MKKKIEEGLKRARELEKKEILSEKDFRRIQKFAEKQPKVIAKLVRSTKDWFIIDERKRPKKSSRRRKTYK